ncbi:Rne/Rng family ribonuclease [Salipaludibacillus daqingensis]|uniref:Rne/Rng family ribonuclease n=1 Tax=Salipaludibacillus daqingensis TaxID=3041001 RepID=UPI00247333D9|nr:Rne/Rng family ribonuclease [Salipaludibacillus daqingensis]
MRTIILHRWMDDIRGAIIENDKVVEWLFDSPFEGPEPGTVIRGKVTDILPGMDAAFVDIGSDKNGFLYKKELVEYQAMIENNVTTKVPSIRSLVTKGQWLNVQVKKEEVGTKGAKLTELLSFPGKYIVYLPEGNYVAVSKKMSSEDIRDNWRERVRHWLQEKEGIILRTLAEDVDPEKVHFEFKRLREQYKALVSKATDNKVSTLYNESSILARVTRDFLSDEENVIVVDDLKDYQYINQQLSDDHSAKVQLHQEKENVFSFYDLDKALEKSLNPFVWLKNGGSLHIDHTEAMTVIDVNSSKFTGKQGLRETALTINLQAAKTIAEQLRLRDIGGIIVIDFIDMHADKDRMEVVEQLKSALQKDRTMTNVLGFTQLGLLEMTRKKTRKPLLEMTHTSCPLCNGMGEVKRDEEIAREIEEMLFTLRYREEEAFLVEVEQRVHKLFSGHYKQRLSMLEKSIGKDIYLISVQEQQYAIRFMGSREEVRKRWEARLEVK